MALERLIAGLVLMVGASFALGAVSACSSTRAPASSAGIVPPDPRGPRADGSGPTVFAISKLYFGDHTYDGYTDDSWRRYGLDIDGKTTDSTSTDVCMYTPAASESAQEDGDNGIDNSFGHSLVSILTSIVGDAPNQANDVLAGGDSTLLIELDGVGNKPSYSPLPGTLFRSTPLATPAWDGTDVRDLDLTSFVADDPARPLLPVLGYMNDRTWVSTTRLPTLLFDLHIPTGGHPSLPVPIHRARLMMRVEPNNRTATGVISGILTTEEVVSWARVFGEPFSRRIVCDELVFEVFAQEIRQAQDILDDGTNESGQPCNALSFGIGFDAVAVRLGKPAPAPMYPGVQPCDAGASGKIDGGM